jgi:hypothetical protein
LSGDEVLEAAKKQTVHRPYISLYGWEEEGRAKFLTLPMVCGEVKMKSQLLPLIPPQKIAKLLLTYLFVFGFLYLN